MKKTNLKILGMPVLFAGLVLTGAFAIQVSNASQMSEKDTRIADLERALDVMEEANTSLKNENEAKQIIIDGLEYELEQAK